MPASELVKEGDRYCLYFEELNAGQMSEVIYLTAYKNDVAVSNTVQYSIESYAYRMQGTSGALAELVQAMMNYGNAAYAYVH